MTRSLALSLALALALVACDAAEAPQPAPAAASTAAAKADGALDQLAEDGPLATFAINEVMNHPLSERDGEYVELYNPTPWPLSLSGWILDDGDAPDVLHLRAGSDVVEPFGYALIVDPDMAEEALPAGVPVYTSGDSALGNGLALSDPISLVAPDGRLVDHVETGVAVRRGEALERRAPDAVGANLWRVVADGSPGARNQLAPSDRLRLHLTHPPFNDEILSALVRFIDGAYYSLDCAIYQLSSPAVLEAMIRAAARGVDVRLVTDTHYYTKGGYADGYLALEQAGILVVPDDRWTEQHNKFLVADGRRVWLGSMNPTDKALYPTADAALEILDEGLAAELSAEVREMLQGQFSKDKAPTLQRDHVVDGAAITLLTSPTDDVWGAVRAELETARRSIHFAAASFSDKGLGATMVARREAGVEVRGVFDWIASGRSWSQWHPLAEAGCLVRRTPHGLNLHHKLIVIDGGTPQGRVIVGSGNFSRRAATANDETVLIVRDARLAAQAELAIAAAWRDTTDEPAPAGGLRLDAIVTGAEPWIRLVNDGPTPIDLGGHALSNVAATVALPEQQLEPGQAVAVALGAAAPAVEDIVVVVGGVPGGLAGVDPVLLLSPEGTPIDAFAPVETPAELAVLLYERGVTWSW